MVPVFVGVRRSGVWSLCLLGLEEEWGVVLVFVGVGRSGMWSLCLLELEGVGCGPRVCWGWKRSGVWSLCSMGLEKEWVVVMICGIRRGVGCGHVKWGWERSGMWSLCLWGWKGSGCYWICLRMCGRPPAPAWLAAAEQTVQWWIILQNIKFL